MGIFAGLISVNDQAVNSMIMGFAGVMFMVPLGIQSAANAIIGESIGANRVREAYFQFKIMSYITLIATTIVMLLIYVYRLALIRFFTNDKDVETIALGCIPIIIIGFLPDCIQGSI